MQVRERLGILLKRIQRERMKRTIWTKETRLRQKLKSSKTGSKSLEGFRAVDGIPQTTRISSE